MMKRFAWILVLLGCGSSNNGLGTQCLMDSECDGSLVCRFGYCRPRCANDKDCADISGSRCVSAEGEGVCLVPDREDCVRGLMCPTGACIALACRSACTTASECISEHTCSEGYCRQPCANDDDCVGSLDECVEGICEPRVLTDGGRGEDAGEDGGTDAGVDAPVDAPPDTFDAGPAFDCTDATEAFEPTEAMVELPAGRHAFTSIHIPVGTTVVTTNTGLLELCSDGDVRIEGTIDLSGAEGGAPGLWTAAGGTTGDPRVVPTGGTLGQCHFPGGGGTGAEGGDAPLQADCNVGLADHQGLGGTFGGGAGAMGRTFPGGGGGGGYAGGGGGSGLSGHDGGEGASFLGDVGGAGGTLCSGGMGGESPGAYAGGPGEMGEDCDLQGGGGGGGAIGASAVADLAVTTTFRPGSAGGGGGGGSGFSGQPGGGGGGAGGALRIASPTRITITGSGVIRVDGGDGGPAMAAGGGGGSGGVVYLAAPTIENSGLVSAVGGDGGTGVAEGGAGGLGRIRLSVLECSLFGTFNPPLPGAVCMPDDTPTNERVYVGTYPN